MTHVALPPLARTSDASQELTADDADQLRLLLARHGVVVRPGQVVDEIDVVAFLGVFGAPGQR